MVPPKDLASGRWPYAECIEGILVNKTLSMLVKYGSSEERVLHVNVQICLTKSSGPEKVLKLQLTTEDDPFFLFTMDFDEEDFRGLKAEQSLVVDFVHFPDKISSLLDKCSHLDSIQSKFQCIFLVELSQGMLQLVETNDFKQLAHLSLKFRPGSETAIKQLFAQRLQDAKGNISHLSASLAHCKNSLQEAQEEMRLKEEQVRNIEAKHHQDITNHLQSTHLQEQSWKADFDMSMNALRQDHAREMEALQSRASNETKTVIEKMSIKEAEIAAFKESSMALSKQLNQVFFMQHSKIFVYLHLEI